jgi:hypothetical protein
MVNTYYFNICIEMWYILSGFYRAKSIDDVIQWWTTEVVTFYTQGRH